MNGQTKVVDVYIILGSNIDPVQNIVLAHKLVSRSVKVISTSSVYETISEGNTGPNFLNAAIHLVTTMPLQELKDNVLKKIEKELGRIRTEDKNAPRTIDLDVLFYDNKIMDDNIWTRVYLAKPLADILPKLRHPHTGDTLSITARNLSRLNFIKKHPEITLLRSN